MHKHGSITSSKTPIKTYPGADSGSDQEVLVAKIKVKFCCINKTAHLPKKFDVYQISPAYALELKTRLLDTKNMMPDEQDKKIYHY